MNDFFLIFMFVSFPLFVVTKKSHIKRATLKWQHRCQIRPQSNGWIWPLVPYGVHWHHSTAVKFGCLSCQFFSVLYGFDLRPQTVSIDTIQTPLWRSNPIGSGWIFFSIFYSIYFILDLTSKMEVDRSTVRPPFDNSVVILGWPH